MILWLHAWNLTFWLSFDTRDGNKIGKNVKHKIYQDQLSKWGTRLKRGWNKKWDWKKGTWSNATLYFNAKDTWNSSNNKRNRRLKDSLFFVFLTFLFDIHSTWNEIFRRTGKWQAAKNICMRTNKRHVNGNISHHC